MLAVIICLGTGAAGSGIYGQEQTPYLWKVRIDGSIFYLAGSIHMAKESSYPLPGACLEAYRAADRVILELKEDFDTLEDMIFESGKDSRLDEEQSLDMYLNESTRHQLEELFGEKKDLLQRYYHYEGWMLNMAIAGLRGKLIGYDPELALDKYFHTLATTDGKEILGLEELETQLQLFEFHVPLETQVRMIENAVAGARAQAQTESSLFEAYFSYDPEAFEKAFLALYDFENPQIKQVYSMLFAARNRAWVEKLKDLATRQPGTWFMLVGCGHYFGPGNVRELLEAEGFRVEPYQ